jgi:simple sugar transport system ATP-binding protein
MQVENLEAYNDRGVKALRGINLTVKKGEILGIAGVAGSGQKELLESIAGLIPGKEGSIIYYPPEGEEKELTRMPAAEIAKLGIRLSFVPEDRLGMGLVGSMDLTDNIMLRSYQKGRSIFADRKSPKKLAKKLIGDLEIATPGTSIPVRKLSGGNVQKVLVGREISLAPSVLLVAYPVRGLDIRSSYTIYHLLNEQKKRGTAVLCVGEDLDVLMELCDRILVMCDGRITGVVDGRTAAKEEIGRLMIKAGGEA